MRYILTLLTFLLLLLCMGATYTNSNDYAYADNERKKQHEDKPVEEAKEETEQDRRLEIYEVTAYTLGECDKSSDDPAYGLTASRAYVQEGRTIAASRSLPFGTRVYIPKLNNTYIVEDRGGDITEGRLDIYMANKNDALSFGRQRLEVIILTE